MLTNAQRAIINAYLDLLGDSDRDYVNTRCGTDDKLLRWFLDKAYFCFEGKSWEITEDSNKVCVYISMSDSKSGTEEKFCFNQKLFGDYFNNSISIEDGHRGIIDSYIGRYSDKAQEVIQDTIDTYCNTDNKYLGWFLYKLHQGNDEVFLAKPLPNPYVIKISADVSRSCREEFFEIYKFERDWFKMAIEKKNITNLNKRMRNIIDQYMKLLDDPTRKYISVFCRSDYKLVQWFLDNTRRRVTAPYVSKIPRSVSISGVDEFFEVNRKPFLAYFGGGIE